MAFREVVIGAMASAKECGRCHLSVNIKLDSGDEHRIYLELFGNIAF